MTTSRDDVSTRDPFGRKRRRMNALTAHFEIVLVALFRFMSRIETLTAHHLPFAIEENPMPSAFLNRGVLYQTFASCRKDLVSKKRVRLLLRRLWPSKPFQTSLRVR